MFSLQPFSDPFPSPFHTNRRLRRLAFNKCFDLMVIPYDRCRFVALRGFHTNILFSERLSSCNLRPINKTVCTLYYCSVIAKSAELVDADSTNSGHHTAQHCSHCHYHTCVLLPATHASPGRSDSTTLHHVTVINAP